MKEETKEKIDYVIKDIEEVIEDKDVPSNVRKQLEQAKEKIQNEKKKIDLRITNAIYLLKGASEDINIPFHTRTDLMNITSQLEEINEKVK